MTTMLNTYTDAIEALATAARMGVELAAMEPAAAVDLACQNAVANASDARTRNGIWAFESTADQIEDAVFMGTVARDALDGVSRPSVGRVQDALIAAVVR